MTDKLVAKVSLTKARPSGSHCPSNPSSKDGKDFVGATHGLRGHFQAHSQARWRILFRSVAFFACVRVARAAAALVVITFGTFILNTLHTLPALAQQFDLSPGKRVVISDSVFRRGSAVIEPQSLAEFDKLARYIQARPELEFEIRGHASNEGTPERNRSLSEDRARAAKDYLVRVYGVAESRIKYRGVGDAQPLVLNTDEVSRARNRRVEFIGLNKITQRTLTNDNNTAADADGRLSVVRNNVQIKAPWEIDFQVAAVDAQIYEYHRINTGADARAEITFKDGTKTVIGANSSIIVYSPQKNRPQDKPQGTVELIRGDLFFKLKGGVRPDSSEFSVNTAGKKFTLGTGSARIGVDSTNQAAISILEGGGKVGSDSGDVELGENYGATVNKSGVQKRRAPDPPRLVEPDPKLLTLVAVSSPMVFKWMNTSFRTRLEVAETDDFISPVFATTTVSDSALLSLKPGKYYFRLVSVDSIGIESRNILHGFSIAQLEELAGFRLIPYLLFLLAVGCIWVSLLLNAPFQSRTLLSWTVQDNNLAFKFVENAPQEHVILRWLRRYAPFMQQWLSSVSFGHTSFIKTLRTAATVLIVAGLLILLR
jgi:hypothetical protein